jgi:hypothetical protein
MLLFRMDYLSRDISRKILPRHHVFPDISTIPGIVLMAILALLRKPGET